MYCSGCLGPQGTSSRMTSRICPSWSPTPLRISTMSPALTTGTASLIVSGNPRFFV